MNPVQPLLLLSGNTVSAVVGKVYGSYVTLFIPYEGTIYECPALLGALLVHDEYKAAWDSYVIEVVKPGTEVSIVITGGKFTLASGSLPVVDILTSKNRPLSMEALERGWAVPMESALLTMSDRQSYLESVKKARIGHEGLWGDEYLGAGLSKIVSAQLLTETRPEFPDFWESWRGPMFCIGVLILLYLAWQQWERHMDPVAAAYRHAVREKDAQRGFLKRWAVRTGRFTVSFLAVNPFRMSFFAWLTGLKRNKTVCGNAEGHEK